MRTKIAVLLLIAAALLGWVVVRGTLSRTAAPAADEPAAAAAEPQSPAEPPTHTHAAASRQSDSNGLAKAAVATNNPSSSGEASSPMETSPEEAHAEYVAQRTSELMDLAMSDDTDSLNTILSELTNRDAEIRKAAVQAAVQFGSRDAIPRLADAALQTEDAQERAEIQQAIEFLKLPSLTEVMEQQKSGSAGAAPNTNSAP